MKTGKSTFALFFGNRSFFPSSMIADARRELAEVLRGLGHDVLLLDEGVTRHGAVETVTEGDVYARFLYDNKGKFDGVVLSLPNFGDETGAVAALQNAGVPIFIQAYPDELDKMGPALRRDSFCGKLSIMDVFAQYRVPFTTCQPHTVGPRSAAFQQNIDYFDRVCRVTGGTRGLRVGALGARTTPFKTVRYDEVALQRHGITVETLDLADIFKRMNAVDLNGRESEATNARLQDYARWDGVPAKARENLVRLGVTMDAVIAEMSLGALAIRCWTELQQNYGISPCVLTSALMERLVPAACEVDVANAVTMHALGLASGEPTSILDWNNNYGDEPDKCVLFHCGNVPASLMLERGRVTDHSILDKVLGAGCGYGCNQGRIRPFPFTYGSMLTSEGKLRFYLGEGRFTEDPLPEDFFGCAGVAEIPRLQDVLQTIGHAGQRHHVSLTPGTFKKPMLEAFRTYLGYDVTEF